MKYLLVDLSGKVDNYDKALYQALEKELSKGKSSIQLLIPGHGLIRLIPNKFSQTEFIVKRLIKALEGLINYIYLLLLVSFKKIDTIHFQWLPFVEVVGIEKYILYLLYVLSPQTKVILTIHNIYPHGVKSMSDSGKQKYKKRFRDTCRNIDNIIVHTESSKMEVIKEFGFTPDIVNIVHHGVFVPKIKTIKKKKYKINKYVILQFGLQTYYKGTDILVDAVNLLPVEYSENIEVRIVGGVGESYLQELKGKDSNSLIHWKSYFLPNDELYEEINNSDVLVLPYREISQSGVLLLSIYFEKNIICSDLPSFIETIHGDLDNSLDKDFFFKNNDPSSLCELLMRYIDGSINNEKIQNRIRHLKNLYSWENAAKATISIYRK